jgi:hypothetical protein
LLTPQLSILEAEPLDLLDTDPQSLLGVEILVGLLTVVRSSLFLFLDLILRSGGPATGPAAVSTDTRSTPCEIS